MSHWCTPSGHGHMQNILIHQPQPYMSRLAIHICLRKISCRYSYNCRHCLVLKRYIWNLILLLKPKLSIGNEDKAWHIFVPGTVVTSRSINIVLLSDTCHSSSGTLSDGVLYQLSMIASCFTVTVTQVCLECGVRVCCSFQAIGGHWEINQKFYFQHVGKYDKRCLDKSMAFFIQVQWDDNNYCILLFW